jgi:hypothetical protein
LTVVDIGDISVSYIGHKKDGQNAEIHERHGVDERTQDAG